RRRRRRDGPVAAASIVPAFPIAKVLRYPKHLAKYWHERWPGEPELRQFLETNIGYRVDPRFRGSVFFYTLPIGTDIPMQSRPSPTGQCTTTICPSRVSSSTWGCRAVRIRAGSILGTVLTSMALIRSAK